jgi:hypothetical protein
MTITTISITNIYSMQFWIAKGTGIFVNVGKTLVSKSWEETVKMLGLTELDDFDI